MEQLQSLVDRLGRRLGRAVAVDDIDLRLLAYSAHEGDIDPVRTQVLLTREAPRDVAAWVRDVHLARATGPVHVPGNDEFGLLPRVAVPVRFQGLLYGYLWLIEPDGGLPPEHIALAETAAHDVGALLFQERALDDLTQERAGSLLRDLLGDDDRLRSLAADGLVEHGLFAGGSGVVVLAVRPRLGSDGRLTDDHRLALTAALRRMSTMLARDCVALMRADHGILVAREGALSSHAGLADEVHATVTQHLNDETADVIVGVGDPCPDLAKAVESYRQALDALMVAEVVPVYRPIARSAELGIYRLLTQLGVTRTSLQELHPAVGILRREDPSLLRTLEEFLDQAGDTRAVASSLMIHRSTVYTRLERISSLTGVDLSRGDDRLALHLSVKLARLGGVL